MMRIFLLGTFRVELDGRPLQETDWPRRKVKNLLKLLALQSGYRLHKEQAIELLWPRLDLTTASRNLYHNLHLLRQVLEPKTTRKSEQGYILLKEKVLRLNPDKGLWVDVEAFNSLFSQVHATTPQAAASLLEKAVGLYSDDLLPEDLYEEWTALAREELRNNYHYALLTLASYYRHKRAYAAAIELLKRLVARDVTNENAHRELILTYTLAGRRSEALNQYQLCCQVLATELGLDPAPETIEIYRQILAGEIKAEPDQTTLGLPLSQVRPVTGSFTLSLPAPVTSLVGREQEVDNIIELLCRKETRLVTLTGMGGVGKTRVGLEVAWSLRAEGIFKEKVCFVPLSELSDPDMLPLAMAQALGIKEASHSPLFSLLKFHLREQELLLVLDNFEPLLKAAPLLLELLNSCPKLKIMVTSRVVLHLYGEHEIVIRPLGVPIGTLLISPVEKLSQYPAIELFCQRARAAKFDFLLSRENASAVLEICARLDGLPLAIELVASRVKLLSPQAILIYLDSWLNQLNNFSHNLPGRHQTVQTTLDWSFNLLGEEEQQLFVRLGVFRGSFTMEAIEKVCFWSSPTDLSATEDKAPSLARVLNLTSDLLDHNLIEPDNNYSPPLAEAKFQLEPRFRMLEIIHNYALEGLKRRGEELTLRQRHLSFFLQLAEELEPLLHGKGQGAALGSLELEHNNLRAALEWAMGRSEKGLVEKGMRLVGTLAWFWGQRGYWSEAATWYELALARLDQFKVAESVQARVLYGAGIANLFNGDYAKASFSLHKSLKLYRPGIDKWGIAHTLDGLAELARLQGKYEEARRLYYECLALFEGMGDLWCRNHEVIALGIISYEEGDFAGASALLNEGLKACRQICDRAGAARAFNSLGHLGRSQGSYQEAMTYYQESLALYRKLGQTGNTALVLHNLGQLCHHQKDSHNATSFLKESLFLSYELKSNRLIIWCVLGLGAVAVAKNTLERAAVLFGAAERLLQNIEADLEPFNQVLYDQAKAQLQIKLDPTNYATLWRVGCGLTLQETVNFALNCDGYPDYNQQIPKNSPGVPKAS